MLILTLLPVLSGCADHNPFVYAQTPLDDAHVALRSFEIVETEAWSLVTDESVSSAAAAKIKTASHAGTLASEQLGNGVIEVEAARAELAAGTTTSERLAIANANLVKWTATLKQRIAEIKAASKEARHHD